jgi:hypothetical protein
MKVIAGTGLSGSKAAATAGREAAAMAVAALAGEPPALVLVFTTPRYDLPALLKGVRSVTGNAQLIGATGSGEIRSCLIMQTTAFAGHFASLMECAI